ncbi:MAG: peptide-methionine (S)-S-oxide reductase MsrA [Bacilli bacterium]|nr:peptide-methionine (S)-S-oxide reductase MsrA [Bacilli bacterium]
MEKTIYIAGGCFWGVEAYYDLLKGVIKTTVGYINGSSENPSYKDLKAGKADHAEAVEIVYDDDAISLETLLGHYLRFVDPYSVDKQGGDVGHQYRTGVFYVYEGDASLIKNYLDSTLRKGYAIEVGPMKNFYNAEEYHQKYLEKNPDGYCHINLSLVKPSERKK